MLVRDAVLGCYEHLGSKTSDKCFIHLSYILKWENRTSTRLHPTSSSSFLSSFWLEIWVPSSTYDAAMMCFPFQRPTQRYSCGIDCRPWHHHPKFIFLSILHSLFPVCHQSGWTRGLWMTYLYHSWMVQIKLIFNNSKFLTNMQKQRHIKIRVASVNFKI